MTIAGKMMKHLLRSGSVLYDTRHGDPNISERKWVQIARIAGLLHDIGHGPFSHAFDRIVYSKVYGVMDGGHDYHRLWLIDQSPLRECIEKCGVSSLDIQRAWSAKVPTSESSIDDVLYYLVKMCVGGPIGADRIDFVLRDSYFTGTIHLGTIAWKRIVYNCTVLWDDNEETFVLAYAYKTLHDIIQALDGRRYMYHGVYLNKTVEAASIIVEKMMEALDKEDNGFDLVECTKDVNKFALLNDDAIIGRALAQPHTDSLQSKMWCERLLKRKLPKMIHEELVDGQIQFDMNVWMKKWFDNVPESPESQNIVIRNTRCITGIDPFKFTQYGIVFYKTKNVGEVIDCASALNQANFKSNRPYYLVRAYKLDDK